MSDKEGGDSEKKMTKDFLDRWKRIASKYEGPEEEAQKAKAAGSPEAPLPTPPEQPEKGAEPHADEDELELDDLMVDFGLQGDEEAAKARKVAAAAKPAPPPTKPATPAAAAPMVPPAARVAAAPPLDDPQRRVLDTLKKVGLVKEGPTPPPAPAIEVEEVEETEIDDAEEEDTLLLELETLLADEGTGAQAGKAKADAALEEEDLISELEGLLEGSGEEEAPLTAKVPPVKAVAPVEPAPVTLETRVREIPAVAPSVLRADIAPPEAPKARPVETGEIDGGRVNGGRVNGGRVNGGRVNGGRVNGGRVNGGRVNGGRVNGGRVNGGRVNGGRVNGGRVNGGRVNGGRVNGGRVNGGRVNGGRVNGGQTNGGKVNGGRVNGGRVNGGRVNGGRGGFIGGAAPVLRAQGRRQAALSAMVAMVVVLALFVAIPFGATARAPAVDGDVSDWAGTSALLYSDAADGGTLPPALDLREFAIRVDEGRLWFEAQAGAAFFTRSGAFPPRADYVLVLIDVDGSSTTGYSYHGLGIDRVVDLYGWNGAIKASATRAWTDRPNVPLFDYSGFETAGGLQVASRGDRIEGALTAIVNDASELTHVKAFFEIRGSDPAGAERVDSSPAPATLSGSAISASVAAIAPATLAPGAAPNAPMLNITLTNPSPSAVQVTGLRLTADYSPAAPNDLSTVSLWNDANGNNRLDAAEAALATTGVALPDAVGTLVNFDAPLNLQTGQEIHVLAAVSHVSTNAANGSSLRLSLASPADVAAASAALVNVIHAPVALGLQPVSYFGSAPTATAVDGNTLEWQGRPSAADPADNANGHIDLRSLQGNVTPTAASFLVTMGGAPLDGALVPLKYASAIELPNTGGGGGGGGGSPGIPPPASGADVLVLLIESDNDTATGYPLGGYGYDYQIRIEGKGGEVLPGRAQVLNWSTAGTPGFQPLVGAVPEVGIGASAIEVGAALPPLVLTARNITVTAYATDWQGARDDMVAPLRFENDQGSRALPEPTTPDAPPADTPTIKPLDVPEFQDIAVPVASLLLIVGMGRRRRRERSVE